MYRVYIKRLLVKLLLWGTCLELKPDRGFCKKTIVAALISCGLLVACAPNTKQELLLAEQNYQSQRYRVSFEQIQSAARMGDADAQYALGYMFFYGRGTAQDTNLARVWIEKAAAQGQPQAQRALRLLQETEQPPIKGNEVPFFNDSVAQNNTVNNQVVALNATVAPPTPPAATQPLALAPHTVPAANGRPITKTVTPLTHATASHAPAPAPNRTKPIPAPFSSKRHYSASEHQLLVAPANTYTLQLFTARHENEVLSFIRTNHLQHKASYYRAAYPSGPLYVVVYGRYPSSAAAHAALKTLPPKVQALKPWVKPLAEVQRGLKAKV